MSPFSSLLPLSLLFLSPLTSLAVPPISPYDDTQAVFSQQHIFGTFGDKFHGMGMEWMTDTKKAILEGKKNLEKWHHEGKEYIKQDNLLCEKQAVPCPDIYYKLHR